MLVDFFDGEERSSSSSSTNFVSAKISGLNGEHNIKSRLSNIVTNLRSYDTVRVVNFRDPFLPSPSSAASSSPIIRLDSDDHHHNRHIRSAHKIMSSESSESREKLKMMHSKSYHSADHHQLQQQPNRRLGRRSNRGSAYYCLHHLSSSSSMMMKMMMMLLIATTIVILSPHHFMFIGFVQADNTIPTTTTTTNQIEIDSVNVTSSPQNTASAITSVTSSANLIAPVDHHNPPPHHHHNLHQKNLSQKINVTAKSSRPSPQDDFRTARIDIYETPGNETNHTFQPDRALLQRDFAKSIFIGGRNAPKTSITPYFINFTAILLRRSSTFPLPSSSASRTTPPGNNNRIKKKYIFVEKSTTASSIPRHKITPSAIPATTTTTLSVNKLRKLIKVKIIENGHNPRELTLVDKHRNSTAKHGSNDTITTTAAGNVSFANLSPTASAVIESILRKRSDSDLLLSEASRKKLNLTTTAAAATTTIATRPPPTTTPPPATTTTTTLQTTTITPTIESSTTIEPPTTSPSTDAAIWLFSELKDDVGRETVRPYSAPDFAAKQDHPLFPTTTFTYPLDMLAQMVTGSSSSTTSENLILETDFDDDDGYNQPDILQSSTTASTMDFPTETTTASSTFPTTTTTTTVRIKATTTATSIIDPLEAGGGDDEDQFHSPMIGSNSSGAVYRQCSFDLARLCAALPASIAPPVTCFGSGSIDCDRTNGHFCRLFPAANRTQSSGSFAPAAAAAAPATRAQDPITYFFCNAPLRTEYCDGSAKCEIRESTHSPAVTATNPDQMTTIAYSSAEEEEEGGASTNVEKIGRTEFPPEEQADSPAISGEIKNGRLTASAAAAQPTPQKDSDDQISPSKDQPTATATHPVTLSPLKIGLISLLIAIGSLIVVLVTIVAYISWNKLKKVSPSASAQFPPVHSASTSSSQAHLPPAVWQQTADDDEDNDMNNHHDQDDNRQHHHY